MTVAVEGVSARLGRDPDDFRRYLVTVQVYSKTKPGLKASSNIDPGKATNQQHLLQLVGTAAAACAEYLGEKYGDNIDPVTASRDALRAFAEEARLTKALALDAPAKVKRLEAMGARLPNQEKELLHKLRWAIDHGGQLTPLEIEWVNRRIAELHVNQKQPAPKESNTTAHTKNPNHGFFGTIRTHKGLPAAKVAWAEAVRDIAATIPTATAEEIRNYLDSDYGHHVAVAVLEGRSVAEQIQFRAARFRRTFDSVSRQMKLWENDK